VLRAFIETDVVRATRTSSVFGKTMQAFFAESTFPMGEGFGLAQQLHKSEFAYDSFFLINTPSPGPPDA
jgi:hypothetical protein